jgi:hypothetical protein
VVTVEMLGLALGIVVLLIQAAVFGGVVWLVVVLVRRSRRRHGADGKLDYEPLLRDVIGQLLVPAGIALAWTGVALALTQAGWQPPLNVLELLGALTVLAAAYWRRAPLTLAIGIACLFGWWLHAWFTWASAASGGAAALPAGWVLLGVAAWLLGRGHQRSIRFDRFGWVWWALGAGLVLVVGFAVSLQFVLIGLEQGWAKPVTVSWQLTAGVVGFIAAVAAAAGYALWRGSSRIEVAALLVVAVAFALLAFVPPGSASGWSETLKTTSGLAWAIVFNLMLLLGLLGLVFLGFQRREDWLINSAAVLLFIFVVAKYFDWLFRFLDRSLAFVIAGLLFIGVGFAMERARRTVIAAMEEAGHEAS